MLTGKKKDVAQAKLSDTTTGSSTEQEDHQLKHASQAMLKTAKLVECIADLQLGNIQPREWLQEMVGIAECEAASVISWTKGNPKTAVTSYSDNHIQIDPHWLVWVDNLVIQQEPEQPELLADIARTAGITDHPNDSPLADPKLLIAYLDSNPAITLFIFRADGQHSGWGSSNRAHLRSLLPGLLKAHLVHKKLISTENTLDMARIALNGIPRAIIGLLPTGEIIKGNDAALEMLDNTVFGSSNGKLTIEDSKVMRQFNDKLAEIRILTPRSLSQFTWNRSFRCRIEKRNYQLMLRGFALESWHLEANSHDRFALLIIGCPEISVAPDTEQLRDFYDLSNAQARVVVSLLEGNDIMTTAAKLHISINTIRSHMRMIYEKLGVDNQRDLLRLLSYTLVDYRSAQQLQQSSAK